MQKTTLSLLLIVICSLSTAAGEKDPYRERRLEIQKRDASQRSIPVIPPKGEKLRVVIDSDAHNEIDDVWAVALALLSPERFQIEGFVAANYDNENLGAGPRSVETSANTIDDLLRKTGLAGKIPVKFGSPPMRYQFEPVESEGVDFIIEKAMASTPEDPLWLIGLGAATNIASAYLKEPRIAERTIIFWHGRTEWPQRAMNFNVIGDVRAARMLFHSDLSFVLFDTGGHLFCPMEESEQWVEFSELGRFLHEFRFQNQWYQSPTKGFYDLGDIAALLDPDIATWEIASCPEVMWDLAYRFSNRKGRILRCSDVDRDKTFELLRQKLKGTKGAAGTRAPAQ
jgi:purine nucleosidase